MVGVPVFVAMFVPNFEVFVIGCTWVFVVMIRLLESINSLRQ